MTQSKNQELFISIIILMIFGSQLLPNIDISKKKDCVEAESLIFILKQSEFCYCIEQSSR